MQFYEELAKEVEKRKIADRKSFRLLKSELSKKHKLGKSPTSIQILYSAEQADIEVLKPFIITKPVRTISGVTPVAVMTSPQFCPHGKCTFCPGGPNSHFGDIAQSYTGNEPASRRSLRNKNDPYLQVMNRLEHYALLNQDFSKCEVIIMGGTFLADPDDYRESFIKYIFKAFNDFSDMFFDSKGVFLFSKFKEFFELPNPQTKERTESIHNKLLKLKGESDLENEQLRNETSNVRCVAMCIETKPDWGFEKHIDEMLRLGTTRVELGVQSIYDKVLEATHRGHSNADSIKSIQLMKDSFLKVGYHIMLGLPSSTRDMDIETFKTILNSDDFKPDALKIYPCRVFPGTALYTQWKQGLYNPIDDEEAMSRIMEIKPMIQKYTRIMRIQRDIPGYLSVAGPNKTNIRQMMEAKGIDCKCIRCREPKGRDIDWDKVKLLRMDYEASHGHEVFLSYEDIKNDILLGFLRLRIPFKPFSKEITSNSAGIRELHVYGSATKIGDEAKNVQHKGFGKSLMNETEKIAKEEFDIKKLLVTSGIGVKVYYRNKLGYKDDGAYVSKILD